jgi:anti-sigma B factor antagonist
MNGVVPVTQESGVSVARLSGDVDISRAEPIKVALLRAIANDEFGLVIDMHEVTYLDSAGVNVLFEVAERLSGRQQRLMLVLPDDALIQRVLELVNAKSVMDSRPTLTEAVAAINALAPPGES